ncbi:MAG: PKD domain-containing protein [Vicinamibacterales bacterium]
MQQTTPAFVKTRLWFLAVLTCVVVVACERVPLTAPTSSTISVTIDKTTLPLNGQATVRAVVIESGGTPVHNGTQVVFATTLGSFTPVEANTVNGVATSVFSAGSISGTTRINAYSGGTSTGSGNSSSGGVEVKIGAAAASGNISVSATPPSVSQSGGTVTISAIVFDQSSNPLPGVLVQFTASNGALSATTAVTDSSGVARTTLNTTQTSTVTAFAGPAKGEVVVTVSAAPSVTVDAPPTGIAGEPVAITLNVPAPAAGTAARQIAQVVVDLGDGTSRTFTNLTGNVAFTHTYRTAGGYTITARASDVNGNTSISSDAIVITRQQNPTVTSCSAPATTPASTPVQVTFGATAAATAQIVSARVTLQDGSVIYSGSSPNNFNHRFGSSGNYTLTCTVTDSNGNTATSSTNVFVTP